MDALFGRPKLKVRYKILPREQLGAIEPLWDTLNEHHRNRSTHFAAFYDMFTFEQRMEKFDDKTLRVRIEVALVDDPKEGKKAGHMAAFSICSVTKQAAGELDSLFVERQYRRRGIGTALAKRAFAWMDREAALSKSLSVVYGNEEVLSFYRMFKFYPSRLELNQRLW